MEKKVQLDAVENLPTKALFGYCSILSVSEVGRYYDFLWYKFIERLTLANISQDRELYGVCANLSRSGFFEYWTAIEIRSGEEVPEDLIDIPMVAGTYGSKVERPDTPLPLIYGKLSEQWERPSDYVLNWRQPFYELYKPNWSNRRAVKFCLPLFVGFELADKSLSSELTT
ncbi:MAG: GyrI-like domain-containing protein [Deltaproteobacteria bacterium]|jgi:predicted transcriptional regulator YdeE|nr:GyrI-like domain-containing protein [Deltaproteobacteria bacterium]